MINRFSDYLYEGLTNQMMKDPSSKVAGMAKRMNLTYMGFGRYADKSGKIKYIVKNDQLIPFKGKETEQANIDNLEVQMDTSSIKDDTKTTQNIKKKHKASIEGVDADEEIKNTYKKQNMKLVASQDKKLRKMYVPSLFTEDEYNALNFYANQDTGFINRYLYKGFDVDTTPDQANQTVETIQNLDNAFEESGAPLNYTVYTGLSPRYDYSKIKQNSSFVFRGYVSSSLNHDNIIDMLDTDQTQPVGSVLEIDIKKGQKSIYMDGLFGDKRNNYETLLPRGTKIQVTSGPHIIDNDITATRSSVQGKQIAIFKCSIVEE